MMLFFRSSCVRDRSGKPTARNERGLGTDSPTRRGTPKNSKKKVTNPEISAVEETWFSFVNQFDGIEAFAPHLDQSEQENISALIQEYYSRMTGDRKVPTKIIGDYGESLILAHEYLRTKDKSNRQHLINKIPTPLGVGYDIQSVELEKKKRYIEVKTTKSRKSH